MQKTAAFYKIAKEKIQYALLRVKVHIIVFIVLNKYDKSYLYFTNHCARLDRGK